MKGSCKIKSTILGTSVRLAQRTIDADLVKALLITLSASAAVFPVPTGHPNSTFESVSKAVAPLQLLRQWTTRLQRIRTGMLSRLPVAEHNATWDGFCMQWATVESGATGWQSEGFSP